MSTPVIGKLPESKTPNPMPENERGRRPDFFGGRRLNLAIKLPLMVILLLSLAFVISTFLSIRATQNALIDTLKSELAAQTTSKAELIRTNLIWTRAVSIDLAAAAGIIEYDEDTIQKVIYNTLISNEQIFGSTIAYEPYKFQSDLYYWSPYYSRVSDTELQFTQLGNPDYNYFEWSWYDLPKKLRTPVLSPPYFDFGGGNIWMVTWSAPFFDQAGNVKGVATADIAFTQVQDIINKIPVGQKGYAFLLDSQGIILGIGDNAGGYYETMADSMITATYSVKAEGWAELVNSMMAGTMGFTEAVDPQGKSMYIAYTPVGLDTGWSLGLAFPKDELIQKASSPQNTLILYSSLTVLFFGAILYLLTRSITQPLHRLTLHASQLSAEKLQLAGGKFPEPIEIHTGDELEDLAEAFNQMSNELSQAFENLEEKVADRSRHLERRSVEFETIAEVAREITIIHDLDTLLNVSADLIRQRFKYYHVGIFLVDERSEYAILRAASSVSASQLLEQGYKLKVGQKSLVGNVTKTGQAHIASDVDTDTIHFQNPLLPQTRSEIVLPLRSRSVTIGALDIQADIQSAFSEQDLKVLQLLADQLSAAIENAQLVQQVEETYAELNKAYRLQSQNVWQSAIDQHQRPSYEYDGIQIRSVPQHLPNDLLKQLENGEPVIIKENDEQKVDHTKTTLMVPLMVLNQVIGVIGLEREDPDHIWTNEEISIVEAAANRAGITLENARLLEESQRRATKERAIGEISAKISASTQIEMILKTAVRELGNRISDAQVSVEFESGDK